MLAIVPVLAVATVVFRLKSSQAYTEARERISVVNADLAENVAGLRVTQAFRREGTNRDRFAALSFGYRSSRLRAQRYIALYFPFVQTLSTVASALVLVVAVGQVRSGALSVGALIAYLLYIDMVFAPIQQLSQVFDGYQQAAVGLSRIKDLLRLRTTVPAVADPVPVPAAGLTGLIELRDVRFSYGAGSTLSGADVDAKTSGEAIAGVSLTVDAGRDGGAGRPDRGGQVHDRQADRPVLRRHRRRGAGRRGGRAGLRPERVPAPARGRAAGGVPVQRHRRRGDRLRPAVRVRRRDRGGGAGGRRARHDHAACPAATGTRSASGAATCRPASGSSSRWPGPSWPTPTSCSSTRRRRRSTWRRRRPSTPRPTSWPRGGPRSWSPTG